MPHDNAAAPRLIPVKELPFSRSFAYARFADGQLKAKKVGRRTFVMESELTRFLSSLPDFQSRANLAI